MAMMEELEAAVELGSLARQYRLLQIATPLFGLVMADAAETLTPGILNMVKPRP